jgi:hypothetical protein
MINFIKTAIITIIISFISGLLLDYYKNLAPRILCNIGNCTSLVLNNKKICAYILTVRNISNKTIHKLTLNIQSLQNDLKIGDAKITKGLKFDSSIEDNIVDVYIPFLSKDDEFLVTLYVENQYEVHNKPVVTIRSPENFKEVDSIEQKGILSLLFNIPKNINNVVSKTMKNNETTVSNKKSDFTTVMNKAPGAKKTINKENREMFHRSRKLRRNKKAMIAIVSIILVISIGVLGGVYFQDMFTNSQTPDAKTNVQKQSTEATESAGGTTKNTGGKASTNGTTKNTGGKASTGGTTKNTGAKTSTDGTTENADAKASTSETTGNTDTKTSTDGTTENTDAKTSTGGITGSTDTKASTGGTTGSTDVKTSTSGTSGSTDTKTSTSGTTGSIDTKTSTSGTTGNTDAKTSTGGTTGNTSN